ncbi:MAG: hypothetical protein IKX06_01810 [Clostridia bacterium]|nr:hypothetical protein [Clostridia bacterium]
MDLEYLMIGIARGSADDLKEYYKATHEGIYSFAFSLLGDRYLARDAAVESYRRVIRNACVFDSAMSAELWHYGMLKNLCVNGLCDGAIAKAAAAEKKDNVSILLRCALFETAEDRGKIVALRAGAGLGAKETAEILWYNKLSCDSEYRRGLREAAAKADEVLGNKKGDGAFSDLSIPETEKLLADDLKRIVPDYFRLIEEETVTAFSNISSDSILLGEEDRALPGETVKEREARLREKNKERKKRNVTVAVAVAASVLLVACAAAAILFFTGRNKKPDESGEGGEPQFRTTASVCATGNKIYFSNYADGGRLYVYDAETKLSAPLGDCVPRDFSDAKDGKIYFRDSAKGELMVLDALSGSVKGTGIKGALPVVLGDSSVAFSSKAGVDILFPDGRTENIFTDNTDSVFRFDTDVIGDTIYFSAAPSDGLYRLSPYDDPDGEGVDYYVDKAMDGQVIYDFETVMEYVVFEDGEGGLYMVNTDSTGKNVTKLSGRLAAGAFSIYSDRIYYYGTAGDGSTRNAVYCISADDLLANKTPVFLFEPLPDPSRKKAAVSDIYAFEGGAAVYFSNGEKERPYNELVLYAFDNSVYGEEVSPKETVLFVSK